MVTDFLYAPEIFPGRSQLMHRNIMKVIKFIQKNKTNGDLFKKFRGGVSLTRTPIEKTPLSLVSSTYPITLAKKSRFSLPVFNVLY